MHDSPIHQLSHRARGQYVIHGDRLNLMDGAEYAALGANGSSDSYDGFTLLTGLRLAL